MMRAALYNVSGKLKTKKISLIIVEIRHDMAWLNVHVSQ